MFDFGAFPTLGTARLALREIDAKFVEGFFAVRSDPVVQRYNSAPLQTHEDTLRRDFEEFAKASGARLSLLDWTKRANRRG